MPFLWLAACGAFHLSSGLNWTSSDIYSEQIKTCTNRVKQRPQCRPLTDFQATQTTGTLAAPSAELKSEQEGVFTYRSFWMSKLNCSCGWCAMASRWHTLNGGELDTFQTTKSTGSDGHPWYRCCTKCVFSFKLSLSGSLVASGLGYWIVLLLHTYLQ